MEKVVINQTGAGAQTITTGGTMGAAFTGGVVDIKTTTAAGAIDISGANLVKVDATTNGAGAQTILSSGAAAVIVNTTSQDGATTITTGAGADTITLFATSAAGANTITAGAGADSITLYTNFSSIDTIVQADGASKAATADTTTTVAAGQTITFGNGLDIINGFNGAVDRIDVGTGGAAISGIGMVDTAFTATKTIFLSGAYVAGTGIFTIAADGNGADTLLLDTTGAGDGSIATADTWILLVGTNSGTLVAGSFI